MLTRAILFALTALAIPAAAQTQPEAKRAADPGREAIVRVIAQIRKADYEGDRAALKRLHEVLIPPAEDKTLASRALYWRGFAMWRRAINGFNETPTPSDLEADFDLGIADFEAAIEIDPAFVDAKIGAGSCFGNLMYLNMKNQPRVQALLQQSSPLLKEAMAMDPDNPRLLWVLGPILWSSPPERGGGQDKAIESYNRGLEAIRKHKPATSDGLEPTWGEPELLMSLAWSNLNRTAPDLNAADQDAHAALQLVPYWHYVRDILMHQIQDAKAKAKSSSD